MNYTQKRLSRIEKKKNIKLYREQKKSMKSRLVLLACCLALLSSCGQGDKGTGKAPEFAVN